METIQKLLEIACILAGLVLLIVVAAIAMIYKAWKDFDDYGTDINL